MKPEELLAHTDFLHALAYSLVRDEDQAADIVQDTLVKALEKQKDSIKNVKDWLAALHLATPYAKATAGASSLTAGAAIMFAHMKIFVAGAVVLAASVFTLIKMIPAGKTATVRF